MTLGVGERRNGTVCARRTDVDFWSLYIGGDDDLIDLPGGVMAICRRAELPTARRPVDAFHQRLRPFRL
jgi:hypothetical protein